MDQVLIVPILGGWLNPCPLPWVRGVRQLMIERSLSCSGISVKGTHFDWLDVKPIPHFSFMLLPHTESLPEKGGFLVRGLFPKRWPVTENDSARFNNPASNRRPYRLGKSLLRLIAD